MKDSEHGGKHIQLFVAGADNDINPEISGLKNGLYSDADNMLNRRTSAGALSRIKGTEILYSDTNTDFTCIGVAEVNKNIVEVLVQNLNNEVRFRINGIVMLRDAANTMGLSATKHIQHHKSDSCNGGELYFTDNNVSPYIFPIQDIIDNYNAVTQKYFSDFNVDEYSINLKLQLNIPVFKELDLLGGTSGVKAGSYAYSIRFVDSTGNRTLFSPSTPLIQVPKNVSDESIIYTHSKTYGGNVAEGTKYGVKIAFRITNTLNYSFVEVRRIKFDTGQAIGYTPIAEAYTIPTPLTDGLIDVWEFVDKDGLDWTALTDEETTAQLAAIESAKSIRYFNNQLVLSNIRYTSKDLTGKVTFLDINGVKAFPFLDKLSDGGHAVPFNSTYKKSLLSGEKYGYAIACYDMYGNVSLVLPYDGATNYQMPNRRDEVTGLPYLYSETNWKGVPRAADSNNNDDKPVYERFNRQANTKVSEAWDRKIFKTGYQPLTPIEYNGDYEGHKARINEFVWLSNYYTGKVNYDPHFGSDYYSQGMMFAGVTVPDWAVGFSIVRTAPAGRVKAQGIATYYIDDTTGKVLNKVAFHSDDIENGLFQLTEDYQVELISPIAYYSEVYSAYTEDDISLHSDMMLYAKDFYTDPNSDHSPFLHSAIADFTKYWVKFNRWRGDQNISNPTKVFDILNVATEQFKGVGRNNITVITLDGNIYNTSLGGSNVNSINQKRFAEPFYICNIIDNGANVPDNNLNQYIHTGHYQKMKSIVGVGTGSPIDIPLVDERWEDCLVNYYSQTKATDNVFVYVDGKAWLNITHKSAGDKTTIFAALTADGYYDVPTGNNATQRIYGVYGYISGGLTGFVEFGDQQLRFIQRTGLAEEYSIPAAGVNIEVRYDNRFPLKVFGGDAVVNESVFPMVDGVYSQSTIAVMQSAGGMPYSGFTFADKYKPQQKGRGNLDNTALQENEGALASYRQILVSYISEGRSHMGYGVMQDGTSYTRQCFPRVHYVMRPYEYNSNIDSNFYPSSNLGFINDQYKVDFPDETQIWRFGGFHIKTAINRDYSQINNYDNFFSKPKVGFTEKTHFCSRHIVSQERRINEMNDPNLKTFIALNIYDMSDQCGGVTFLYDNNSDKGNNLIAIAEKGICLLVTDKKIISQMDAGDLTAVPSDTLITNEYWLSREVGCPDEMWRGIAEYNNLFFMPNRTGVYLLNGLQLIDISKNNKGSYYQRLITELKDFESAFTQRIEGVYNVGDNEYWLHINKKEITDRYVGREQTLNLAILSNSIHTNDYVRVFSTDNNVITPKILILPNTLITNFWIECNLPVLHIKRTITGSVWQVMTAGQTARIYFSHLVVGNPTGWQFELISAEEKLTILKGATFVFDSEQETFVWKGAIDYNAEKMIYKTPDGINDGCVLLVKNNQCYKTGIGELIDEATINGKVKFYVSKDGYMTKEFISQIINANIQPTKISYGVEKDAFTAIQTAFRDYGNSYFTQIPRRSDTGKRMQGNYMECEIECESAGNWTIRSVETNYKLIV